MDILELLNHLDQKSKLPLVPLMSQEEFDSLPKLTRIILTCNYPNCGNVISKQGMVCVEHTKFLEKEK